MISLQQFETCKKSLVALSVALGFAHDWANRENTLRSWDLVARYVVPEINRTTVGQRASMKFLNDNQAALMAGAGAAVMQKILGDERASAELRCDDATNAIW